MFLSASGTFLKSFRTCRNLCKHVLGAKMFKQTKNELKHNLEQLRALDNGININVMLAKKSPIGIDTQKDYLAIKEIMKYKI